jgi:outer membrane protein assembly factor BamA
VSGPRGSGLLLLLLLFAPGPAPAQVSPVEEESPRVESVAFEGVEGIRVSELEESIVTRDTRCLGPLVRPLCWLSGSDLFRSVYYLDREELQRDVLRIRVTYFRRGYRQVQVESSLAAEGSGVRVTFHVTEGPLTSIADLDVVRRDTLLTDADVEEAKLPAPGGALDLVRLDSATAQLERRLWDLGHAHAEVDAATDVGDGQRTAEVTVTVEPGRVVTVGEVFVLGNERVSERTIRRLFELQSGDLFRRTAMTAAQRRLWETELFQVALVDATPAGDSAQDLRIFVREAPPRAITVGPGFNTTEFVQGELRFTRYNWLGGARRLDTRVAVGNILAPQLYGKAIFGSGYPGVSSEPDPIYLRPTWQVGVSFTQPFFLTTKMSLGLGASAYRRSLPDIVIDRGYAFEASLTRRLFEGAPLSLTYRYEQTHVDANQVYFCVNFGVCDPNTVETLRRSHQLSPLGLEAFVERLEEPTSLASGFRARARAEVASALTLSDFRHLRFELEGSRYVEVGSGVFAGHLRAGWVGPLQGVLDVFGVEEGGLPILHPRRRFYAGGSRSVRGYGENQLGPRVLTVAPDELIFPVDTTEAAPPCSDLTIADGSCDPEVAPSEAFFPQPLGGNTLVEGSLEYRFPLGGSLIGAAFVDAGLLYGRRVNVPPGDRAAITPGFGVRYQSPLGPVRIDIGIRPSLVEHLPVVTQTVGPDGELVLVQLDRLKRYDPLERTAAGFLGGFFRRLQIHLALGEAF